MFHLPATFDQWFALIAIAIIAVFQYTKAFLMWRRTVVRDRLGTSLIAANVALGSGYAWGAFNRIHLHTHSPWEERLVLAAILAVVAWSLYELILTTRFAQFAAAAVRESVFTTKTQRTETRNVTRDTARDLVRDPIRDAAHDKAQTDNEE
jgi:hypothetical protein